MTSLIPFHWVNPTHIAFGVGAIDKFRQYIKPGQRIAVISDGKTPSLCGAKKDLDSLLDKIGVSYKWYSGIEANPDYDTCLSIIKKLRKNPVDYLIAVGGGSVMDATKFIGNCIPLPESIDLYSTMFDPSPIKKSIPKLAICTLSATGSEWNSGYVISRRSTGQKQGMRTSFSFFDCSVLDPRYTLTVPADQTANGIYDSFCHVMEQYATNTFAPLPDRLSEAVTSSIIENGPKLMKDLHNLDLRGGMMQNSAWALNHSLSLSTGSCWGTHGLGHMLTARYGMDHGKTLAVIMPNLWRHFFDTKKFKLAQMSRRVFGKGGAGVDEDAKYAIERVEGWTQEIGMKLRISDYVKENDIKKAVEELTAAAWRSKGCQPFGENGIIKQKDCKEIYEASF